MSEFHSNNWVGLVDRHSGRGETLAPLGTVRARRRTAGRRRARGSPFRLDVLEDRTAPAVFPVTSLADGGLGSLRQAVLVANATPGDDAIAFGVTGTINLAGALPDLSTNIDIRGPG